MNEAKAFAAAYDTIGVFLTVHNNNMNKVFYEKNGCSPDCLTWRGQALAAAAMPAQPLVS